MTPEELAVIEARTNNATPGPWAWFTRPGQEPGRYNALHRVARTGRIHGSAVLTWARCGANNDIEVTDVDAEFIAAARADVPALINAVRERDEEITRLKLVIEANGMTKRDMLEHHDLRDQVRERDAAIEAAKEFAERRERELVAVAERLDAIHEENKRLRADRAAHLETNVEVLRSSTQLFNQVTALRTAARAVLAAAQDGRWGSKSGRADYGMFITGDLVEALRVALEAQQTATPEARDE